VEIGGLKLDVARTQVTCDGQPVELSATEFALLDFLMHNPGWVFAATASSTRSRARTIR
jgi:DNA-binding response OmpR family regulator